MPAGEQWVQSLLTAEEEEAKTHTSKTHNVLNTLILLHFWIDHKKLYNSVHKTVNNTQHLIEKINNEGLLEAY